MTEEQLQQIKNGELWIENDLSFKKEDAKLTDLLRLIWPQDGWVPGGLKYYRANSDTHWGSEEYNLKNKPTIKASTLLEETISSSHIQLYPLC